jgi:hypothetical protein
MKFDASRAWREASDAVTANREVLFAIAGVFILLPTLAFSLLFPQPQPPAGLEGEAAMQFALDYYGSIAPWVIGMGLVQAIGTLSMLTLFTDRSRPTVGEALRRGIGGLLPYFGAQLLLGLGIGLGGGVLIGIAGAIGAKALVGVFVVAVIVVAAYAAIKTSLVAPVIMVEGLRNPALALQRSWRLTRGNSGRIALFYLMVGLAFMVGLMVVMMVVGAILALTLGTGEMTRMIAAAVSGVLGTAMTIYFVAILAAVHRQLTGPSPDAIGATFD